MESERAIGIGLIGVGRHGIRYARHIVHDLPAAALVAVSRRHPDQGLNVPDCTGVTMYGDALALIADPRVDVVVVVTPPVSSRDYCLAAVRAGKPVLIEKPLATTAEDARAMVAAAAAARVPLMTGQTLRFDATIQALKAKRSMVGTLERVRLQSRIDTKDRGPSHADGYGKRGALLEFGVHLLDLVRFLTDEDVGEVRCTMDPVPPAAPDRTASVQLRTVQGTGCLIDVARAELPRVGTAVMTGSEGRLSADWVEQRLEWTGHGQQTISWPLSPCPTVLATLQAFVEAVIQKRSMPITGEDGLRAVETAEACYRSAAAHGTPVALPLP